MGPFIFKVDYQYGVICIIRASALMRLVLGLNWIASPQSLIDTCMPQFIMISNEKIIHRGHPIANSICGLEAALSTSWFPREFRGHGVRRDDDTQDAADT